MRGVTPVAREISKASAFRADILADRRSGTGGPRPAGRGCARSGAAPTRTSASGRWPRPRSGPSTFAAPVPGPSPRGWCAPRRPRSKRRWRHSSAVCVNVTAAARPPAPARCTGSTPACGDRLYLNLYQPLLQTPGRCRPLLSQRPRKPGALLRPDGPHDMRLRRRHQGLRLDGGCQPDRLREGRAQGRAHVALPGAVWSHCGFRTNRLRRPD